MSLSEFDILTKIGEGAYSTVYKARRHSDAKLYAIKKVKIQKLSDKEQKNALNEIRIMASIKHPNIISYKEAFFDEADDSLCLIMEYADSGDLWQRIQRCIKCSVRLNEKTIWSIFTQITRGLQALHELGVFHRDLKSANVFLNKDGTVKLGDMNVSKVSKDGFLRTQTGTPYYASPEVWKDLKYSNKSDIWSLGCVLYESITLKPPFRAADMEGLHDKVVCGEFQSIPRNYSKDLWDIVKLLLRSEPETRPSCEEILGMECVTRHFEAKTLNSSSSGLIKPIKVPKMISQLSCSLPRPDYEGFETVSMQVCGDCLEKNMITEREKVRKLPLLKIARGSQKKQHLEMHKIIENSSDRLRRIREIYLSPSNIFLTPNYRKSHKRIVLKKNIFG